MQKKITVGTNSLSYNHIRNFAGLPFTDVTFEKLLDWYRIPAYLSYKVLGKTHYGYVNRFNDFGLNKVDLYHFFNSIGPIKKPWVVTYETSVPRMQPDFRKGYEWLAGPYCKQIIPYSHRAYNAELHHLEKYPEYREAILAKTQIIPPSQKILLNDFSEKKFDQEHIIFTFTGTTFFGKGGWEILQVFEKAKEQGWPIKLNLISKLHIDGYRDGYISPEIVEKAKNIIATNPLITHYFSLPNPQVLEVLKNSHVALLPSFGETYGYSVLEGMSMGCIPVTTNLSPFPEFVNEEWGYLIPINRLNINGVESAFTNFEEYKENAEILLKGLLSFVENLLNNRSVLQQKAHKAFQRIETHHSPLQRVMQLRKIYEDAIL